MKVSGKQNLFRRILNTLLISLFIVAGFVALGLFVQVFLYASFNVTSDSMNPEVKAGDHVIVFKPIMGARLFNIISDEQPHIYRIPGFGRLKRNDVITLNPPLKNIKHGLVMDTGNRYLKRCIALPGDTISIINGRYKVEGFDEALGNPDEQAKLQNEPERRLRQKHLWQAFPFSLFLDWNIKEFGPLLVPAEGTEIVVDNKNYLLYRNLIEWENGTVLSFNYVENRCYSDDKPLHSYRFRQNYYFVAGDRVADSYDSRYWGLLPEDFIIGKVLYVQMADNNGAILPILNGGVKILQ